MAMLRHAKPTLVWVTILMAPAMGGCAKRSTPGDGTSAATAPIERDVLLDVSRNDDATPLTPPALTPPGAFPGPPWRPPAARAAFEGVTPPAAIPEAGSSTSSDFNVAPRELVEADPASPEYVSPTLEIDRARLFRRRDEWTLAETAADALGRIGAPATREAVAMLDDPNPTIRRRGCEILARIGGGAEEAIEPLIGVLERDPDPQIRKAAAYALGQMGPQAEAAVPALTRILRDSAN
jgi:hypothetical protein